MIKQNIKLGKNVTIDESSSINNVDLANNVKIAKNCSIFGRDSNLVKIGVDSYVGMNTILNGYSKKLTIGENVSIAANVHIMTDSGPNASAKLQEIFPLISGPVTIGDHCWLGTNSIIMPGVSLGNFCIVAANSFVNKSFDGYVVVGGNPAKIIKELDPETLIDKDEN